MKLVFENENEKQNAIAPFLSNEIFPDDIAQSINGKLPDECCKNGKRTCVGCWDNFFTWQEQLGNIVIEKEE